jgi:hypothetical protein
VPLKQSGFTLFLLIHNRLWLLIARKKHIDYLCYLNSLSKLRYSKFCYLGLKKVAHRNGNERDKGGIAGERTDWHHVEMACTVLMAQRIDKLAGCDQKTAGGSVPYEAAPCWRRRREERNWLSLI